MPKLFSTHKKFVTIEKSNELEQCRSRAKKELQLISEYRRILVLLCACFDMLFLIPILRGYGSYIQDNWGVWLFLGVICFILNLFIDNFLIDFYWEVAKQDGLNITDKWKSGSIKEFRELVDREIRCSLNLDEKTMFSIYNVSISPSEYICEVIILE